MALLYSGRVTESTGNVLEFFTVETRSLFAVFLRGYEAKAENQAHSLVKLAWHGH